MYNAMLSQFLYEFGMQNLIFPHQSIQLKLRFSRCLIKPNYLSLFKSVKIVLIEMRHNVCYKKIYLVI